MFPVFSVQFRVCSQLKPLERRGVPTVPTRFACDSFVIGDSADSQSSERGGNTRNRRNQSLYESVAMFPVEGRCGNSGNQWITTRKLTLYRSSGKASKLRAAALAPVKPYPQASALSLVQPSAVLRRLAWLHRWAIPSA
jgi:hypothetical protein